MDTKLGFDNMGYNKEIFKFIGSYWDGRVDKVFVSQPPLEGEVVNQTVSQKLTQDLLNTVQISKRQNYQQQGY